MPSRDISWMDVCNLLLTIGSCLIGVVVAVRIGSSADDLSQSGLFVSSASLLLEDDANKQCAGVDIVRWLRDEKHLPPPGWMVPLVQNVLSTAVSTAPTEAAPPSTVGAVSCRGAANGGGGSAGEASAGNVGGGETPGNAGAKANSATVGSALLDAVAGTTPRLYIQIADESQRPGAQLLRHSLSGISLNGQAVVAPGIEKVDAAPSHVELRFLKKADSAEATVLAGRLQSLLKALVAVQDLSAKFDSDAKIKDRTYELWFPHGFSIVPPG